MHISAEILVIAGLMVLALLFLMSMFARLYRKAGPHQALVVYGIRGTRISVEFLLELVAGGASRDDIVRTYPHLTSEDVEEALRYAARFLKNEVLLTVEVAA